MLTSIMLRERIPQQIVFYDSYGYMFYVYCNLCTSQGYREDAGLNLESDADEQLLIYIPFTQVVKLYSVVVQGPEEEGIC